MRFFSGIILCLIFLNIIFNCIAIVQINEWPFIMREFVISLELEIYLSLVKI